MTSHPEPVPAVPGEPSVLPYAGPDDRPQRPRGKGFLALAASMCVPGLGQWWAGFGRRAAVWFGLWLVVTTAGMACLAVAPLAPALLVLLPLSVVIQVANWVDAFRSGRRSGRSMLGRASLRYAAGVALLAVMVFARPAVLPALYVRDHWCEAFVVPTSSMTPTLQPHDRFLVHKARWQVRRGDLIMFDAPGFPGEKFVKRVAGLPGETVEFRDHQFTANGQVVAPPAGLPAYTDVFPGGSGLRRINGGEGTPITLGPDEYYVLGDNPPISGDSRVWPVGAPGHRPGVVPKESVVGRATWIYWPPSRWRRLD